MVSTTVPRPTIGQLNCLHEGTGVKKLMGLWHLVFDPKKHCRMYVHGTYIKPAIYCTWVVWWDDGYNWIKYICQGKDSQKDKLSGKFSKNIKNGSTILLLLSLCETIFHIRMTMIR